MEVQKCRKCEYFLDSKGTGLWCIENGRPIEDVKWCGVSIQEVYATEDVETG